MNALKRTLSETVILLVVGATIAFAGNALRSRNSIELSRNYFEIKSRVAPTKVEAGLARPLPTTNPATVAVGPAPTAPATNPALSSAADTAPEIHLEHEYQPINLEAVKSAFEDPRREQGLIVFVDARADEPFASGHIPGALQCDHYNLAQFIGPVVAKTRIAEQVIVYCNGGQCEDSILMCQNLLENGLDYNAVFLYEGGWKEWEKSGMPIAKGRGDSP